MLKLPEKGISYSVDSHNSELDKFCDWLESSVIFSTGPLYKSDVVDYLLENEVYIKQDFANAFVNSAWAILRERFARFEGILAIESGENHFDCKSAWTENVAYSFCLLLTCLSYLYPNLLRDKDMKIVYGTQGAIFEKICSESLQVRFPGWTVRRVGWSPDNAERLSESIDDIIKELCEVDGAERATYVDSHANELGLDILLFNRFDDRHPCLPVVLVQCASGKDWIRKKKTPDLAIWNKVVSFNSMPIKGFAMPFAFVDEVSFRKGTAAVQGVFLDRYRVVRPTVGQWMSESLKSEVTGWMTPFVEVLPVVV